MSVLTQKLYKACTESYDSMKLSIKLRFQIITTGYNSSLYWMLWGYLQVNTPSADRPLAVSKHLTKDEGTSVTYTGTDGATVL